jgi:hypothetical protein
VRVKTKAHSFKRIGLNPIPKYLSKFVPPPEFASLYQKNKGITNTKKRDDLPRVVIGF